MRFGHGPAGDDDDDDVYSDDGCIVCFQREILLHPTSHPTPCPHDGNHLPMPLFRPRSPTSLDSILQGCALMNHFSAKCGYVLRRSIKGKEFGANLLHFLLLLFQMRFSCGQFEGVVVRKKRASWVCLLMPNGGRALLHVTHLMRPRRHSV